MQIIVTRPRGLKGGMWSEFATLGPMNTRKKLIKQKILASSSTPDSDPSPLQGYVPTNCTRGSRHRWPLFNWRGENVVRSRAEGHFRDRSSPGALWKSCLALNVCGHTDLGCRSFPSGTAQLGDCWASDNLLCCLAFSPTPPSFLFCSVSFLSHTGIIPVITGVERCSV